MLIALIIGYFIRRKRLADKIALEVELVKA